jgi:hypothetical protein
MGFTLWVVSILRRLFLFYFHPLKLHRDGEFLDLCDSTGGNSPAIFSPKRHQGWSQKSTIGGTIISLPFTDLIIVVTY